MRRGAVYVGLDLGTSSLKAVAIRPSGTVAARAVAGYPTHRPERGAAEQRPSDWLAALGDVVGELCAAVPAARWRAVGLSAMIPTLVLADAGGRPVGRAILWEDARAERHGARIRDRLGGDRLYRQTGQWLDGRYLLAMYARLAHDQPERAIAVGSLLGAKDFLFAWLTGHLATDPSTAAGFGCYRLEPAGWLPDVTAATAGGCAGRLPALPQVLPASTIRALRDRAARRLRLPRALPVCLGAADSVLGALALGVRRPGQVAYVAGTSTVVLAHSARLSLDPGHRFLVTPLAGELGWGLEMDLLSTGSAMRWLAGLLGGRAGAERSVLQLAGRLEPGAGPVVLPYLAPGEQGALWDPALLGTVLGLHLGHRPEHLARGLVDGIILESRRCLAVLEEAGLPRAPIRVTGASAGARFCADLADATNREVRFVRRDASHSSAIGAAALAAWASDRVVVPRGQAAATLTVRPRTGRQRRWAGLWEHYEPAAAAVRALYQPTADAR